MFENVKAALIRHFQSKKTLDDKEYAFIYKHVFSLVINKCL